MLRKPLFALLGALAVLASGCSGRRYDEGMVRREHVHAGLFDFERDAQREQWSLFWEHVATAGATSDGLHYSDVFAGAVLQVNIPGFVMAIFYPFQYFEQPRESRHLFGIGSGEGDIRISVLWGLISIGRHWNIFWLRGFWFAKRDPLYAEPSPEAIAAIEAITIPEDGPPPASP